MQSLFVHTHPPRIPLVFTSADRRPRLGDQVLTSVLYEYGSYFTNFTMRAALMRDHNNTDPDGARFGPEIAYDGLDKMAAAITSISGVVPAPAAVLIRRKEAALRMVDGRTRQHSAIFCGPLATALANGSKLVRSSGWEQEECLRAEEVTEMMWWLKGVNFLGYYKAPLDTRFPFVGMPLEAILQGPRMLLAGVVAFFGIWCAYLLLLLAPMLTSPCAARGAIVTAGLVVWVTDVVSVVVARTAVNLNPFDVLRLLEVTPSLITEAVSILVFVLLALILWARQQRVEGHNSS